MLSHRRAQHAATICSRASHIPQKARLYSASAALSAAEQIRRAACAGDARSAHMSQRDAVMLQAQNTDPTEPHNLPCSVEQPRDLQPAQLLLQLTAAPAVGMQGAAGPCCCCSHQQQPPTPRRLQSLECLGRRCCSWRRAHPGAY